VAIAETRERALARTELVADIASVENRDLPWTGSAAVIGSVEDVVEEAKAFGALGDGLLIVPISVPADLTAVHEIL
jgi:alkanesulfonate monooxygenase SsuD/methylene tetrahydromethanopterin reductase-like flavin-dependent oxidoreductase (luciferase family)